MKYPRMIWPLLAAVQLLGCASSPQLPVSFTDNALSGRVGVVMTALPKVDTSFPGASCLLCLAAAVSACGGIEVGPSLTRSDLIGTWKDGSGGALRFYANHHVEVDRLDLTQAPTTTGGFCGFVSGTGTWQFESSGTSPAHKGVFVDLTLGEAGMRARELKTLLKTLTTTSGRIAIHGLTSCSCGSSSGSLTWPVP